MPRVPRGLETDEDFARYVQKQLPEYKLADEQALYFVKVAKGMARENGRSLWRQLYETCKVMRMTPEQIAIGGSS